MLLRCLSVKDFSLGKINWKHMRVAGAMVWRISGADAADRIFAWKYVYGSDHKCVALDRICSSAHNRRQYDPGSMQRCGVCGRVDGYEVHVPACDCDSIDALAVGVSFAFLKVAIVPAVCLIGIITFVCSAAGVKIGSLFGVRYRSKAELCGGVILILIAVKTLAEGLGSI